MPLYVRVKDPSTGHEFDVLETSILLRRGAVKRIKADRYPPCTQPRRTKYSVKLAGQSAVQNRDASPEASSEANTSED